MRGGDWVHNITFKKKTLYVNKKKGESDYISLTKTKTNDKM